MPNGDHFQQVLAARIAASGIGDHAAPETLVRYAQGELTPADEGRLQDHLVRCRRCAELMADLETFIAPADSPAAEVGDFETAAALRAMRARLATTDPPPAEARPRAATLPRRYPALLAAALLVAAIGLSFEVLRQRGDAHDLRQQLASAQLNLPIAYLDPPARGDDGAVRLAIGDAERFLLILTPTASRRVERFEVRVVDGEREVWRESGLELSELGTLRLLISRQVLPPGSYRLELVGLAGEERTDAGAYDLVVARD